MEEKAQIDDIVNIMSGQFDMSGIMSEIMDSITKVTQDKLLNSIKQTYNQYREEGLKESNKEINLFNAMKAFVPEHQRGDIDRITNLLGDMRAINHIMNEVRTKSVQKQSQNSAMKKVNKSSVTQRAPLEDTVIIEDNTIYEIDRKCQGRIQTTSTQSNMLPLLLILLMGTSF